MNDFMRRRIESRKRSRPKVRSYLQTNQKVLGQPLLFSQLSPITQSQSKQLFSFGKSDRFPMDNPRLKHNASFVAGQTDFGADKNKGSSFGCGGRLKLWEKKDCHLSPSPVHYDLPTTKANITSTFGAEIRRQNKPKENIHNKVFNKNPGPGSYLVNQINTNFNRKIGFIGPKPKEKEGRPNRGSIYEDPTAQFPGPTRYQQKLILNVTGQSGVKLEMQKFLKQMCSSPKDKKKPKSMQTDSDKDSDDGTNQLSQSEPVERPKTAGAKGPMKIKQTMQIAKFRSPPGVILGSKFKRFQLDDVLRQTNKIPAPNHYITAPKIKVKQRKRATESQSSISLTPSEMAEVKLTKAMSPVNYPDERRFKNHGQTVFGVADRSSWIMNKERIYGPGPGHYRQHSEFGLYSNTDEMGTVQQMFFDKRARILNEKSKRFQSPATQKRPITANEIKALKKLRLDEPIRTPEQLDLLHLKPK